MTSTTRTDKHGSHYIKALAEVIPSSLSSTSTDSTTSEIKYFSHSELWTLGIHVVSVAYVITAPALKTFKYRVQCVNAFCVNLYHRSCQPQVSSKIEFKKFPTRSWGDRATRFAKRFFTPQQLAHFYMTKLHLLTCTW